MDKHLFLKLPILCAFLLICLAHECLSEEPPLENAAPVVSLQDIGNRYTKIAYALASFGAAEYLRAEALQGQNDSKEAGKNLMLTALQRIDNAQKILQLSLNPEWYAKALKRNLDSGNTKIDYEFFGIQNENDGMLETIDIDEAFAELVHMADMPPETQKWVQKRMKDQSSVFDILSNAEILDVKSKELEEKASGKLQILNLDEDIPLPDMDIFQLNSTR